VTNGNGLIEHSDQRPISPVLLSSNTPAHVMRSRLNQYKVSGKFQNNVVVSFDGENGTTVSSTKASTAATKGKKKKKAVDI
jgi:NAD kinase